MQPLAIKTHFPIFTHQPNLVYLDSAATTLKPLSVINAERMYLEKYSANIARGLYPLAEQATEKFEAVREKVARFIGALPREIIFTSGTTASINLAAGLLEPLIQPGDNIVVTELEHHSNFLPWKELAVRTGAEFRIAPIDQKGDINIHTLGQLVDARTALVALTAVSNVTGSIHSVATIIQEVKGRNPRTLTLIDAAQAAAHMPLRVSEWNADLVAFSAHKMFAPTGVGVLYGKRALLETLRPVAFGGGMVLDACSKEATYREVPTRFEAGTPNIGGVIAFGAALDYIESLGLHNIRTHEKKLTEYALKRLTATFADALRIIGPNETNQQSGILAFTFKNIHPHDIAQLLGEKNICVRAGEHCAAPLHRALKVPATTRLSFSIYNEEQDIDTLIDALKEIQKIFVH